MKISHLLLIVIVFFSIGEASFERPWTETRNQALGNSSMSIISRAEEPFNYLSTTRITIQPSDLERKVVTWRQARSNYSIGFYWDSFGDRDIGPGLSYIEETKSINGSLRLNNIIEIGGRFKILQLDTAYKGNGISLDLGIGMAPSALLKFGLECQGLFNKITYTTGHVDMKPLEYTIFAESNIKERTNVFLAVNNYKEVSAGFEFIVIPQFILRVGKQQSGLTGGLEIQKDGWIIEYAVLNDLLGMQQMLSLRKNI